MSVLSCELVDSGEVRVDRRGASTLVDQYIARMSSIDDRLTALRRGLPRLQRWQPHFREPSLFVEDFEATQIQWTPNWRVRVSYTSELDPNPLDKPLGVKVRSQSIDAYTLVDHEGRLMLNTAGDPFQPQQKKETIWIFSCTKNVADYPLWLLEYPETINLDSVRIRGVTFPPRTLALVTVQIEDYVEENDTRYLPLGLELHFRRSTWQSFIPSRGYQAYFDDPEGGAPVKRRITLDDGSYPNEPQLLDRRGRWIQNPRPQDVYMLKFQLPRALPFGALPLR